MSDLVENQNVGFLMTWLICLFVILIICHFGFEFRILVLILPVPDHFLLFTSTLFAFGSTIGHFGSNISDNSKTSRYLILFFFLFSLTSLSRLFH